MSIQRFVGKTSRAAMREVRAQLGSDAVIIANRSCDEGIEVLAMAAEAMDRLVTTSSRPRETAAPVASRQRTDTVARPAPTGKSQPESFTDYLKRAASRRGELSPPRQAPVPRIAAQAAAEYEAVFSAQMDDPETMPAPAALPVAAPSAETVKVQAPTPTPIVVTATPDPTLIAELQAMKGMLRDQLAQLAVNDLVRRSPVHGKLLGRLIQAGYSPVLARFLADKLPAQVNETAAMEWLAQSLTQNLQVAHANDSMIEQGGVYALVGPTGVGKTTTTAKLAARAAMRWGVKKLGLITVDCYRMGGQDQLRSYGKILGCPVHAAHDAASLNDLVTAMRDRHLVLIDTVGMPQRDPRLNEQIAMLMGPGIERVVVLNAAAQAETLEEVTQSWRGPRAQRAIVTKLDEAVKLGGVVDVAIRHRLCLHYVANGQRVPEDIHAAHANLLVHRSLRAASTNTYQLQSDEVALAATPLTSAVVGKRAKGIKGGGND